MRHDCCTNYVVQKKLHRDSQRKKSFFKRLFDRKTILTIFQTQKQPQMHPFSTEFKEALRHLPIKEKDKLIVRLLKKDLNLAKRLMFELVDTRSVDEHRLIVEKLIISQVARMSNNYYSIGYLNVDVRHLSADITDHVRTTKDKYGNASLNLLLLNEVLKLNKDNIAKARPRAKLYKFCTAIIARVYKVLILINKMDNDLLLDFKPDLITLGKLISENEIVMDTAINQGLDVNWLLFAEIPEDIASIHKNLKASGLW